MHTPCAHARADVCARKTPWDTPRETRCVLSLHVHEKDGDRGPRELERTVVPSRRYAGSRSLYDFAATVCIRPNELGGILDRDGSMCEANQIRVLLTKVDLWDRNAVTRWQLLSDYETTLDELDRSYHGFNTIKFLQIHSTPTAKEPAAQATAAPSINAVLSMAPLMAKVHLPPKYSIGAATLSKDRVLYNDIVDLCKKHGACFSHGIVALYGNLFALLCDYLDCNTHTAIHTLQYTDCNT